MITPEEAEKLYNKVGDLSASHTNLLREFADLTQHIEKLSIAKAEVYSKIKGARIDIKKIVSSLE